MSSLQFVEYQDNNTALQGLAIIPEGNKKPVVMIAPDWSGRNHFAKKIAEDIAALGYIGFALDLYGDGRTGNTKEEKIALMSPLMQDRELLLARMQAGFAAAKTLPSADESRIAVIGFCFGGLCALDLARSSANIKGAVSFHGLLNAPSELTPRTITAKILALHGFDDPMVTPDQVTAFGDEMTTAKADWQLTMYGNTMHAFMNPEAHDRDFGTVYQPATAARAWRAMQHFMTDIFNQPNS